MYTKIMISGEVEILTGLHIGTGGEYSAIGAADSPVIRDALTGLPVIPGSSLKGKLRSLLAKKYNQRFAETPDNDVKEIVSLFGGMKAPSKLIFSDMFLNNFEKLLEVGVHTPTEIKFENTINRKTAVANPRQIERVIRQCKFDLKIVYNVDDENDIDNDFKMLADGMTLLLYDYLGGSGSRGYGKIKFNNLNAESVVGNDNGELDDIIRICNQYLRDVSEYEI